MSELADLVAAARADAPPADSQARTWADLQAAVGSGKAPLVDPSAPDALGQALGSVGAAGSGAVLKIVVVAAIAGAVAVGIVATRPSTPPSPPRGAPSSVVVVPPPTPEPAEPTPAPERQPPASAPEATPPDPPVAEPPPKPDARRVRRPAGPKPPAAPTPNDGAHVIEETRLLTRAWAAIRAGEYDRALSLTDEHLRRFPKGALVEEREASRTVALCQLGRRRGVHPALRRFVRSYPGSVHEARVRAACDPERETD